MAEAKRGSTYSLPVSEYDELLLRVSSAGYLERTYGQHLAVFVLTISGLGLVAFLIVTTDTLWIQLLNASLAAFLTVQLGLIGHDLSHHGVFRSKKVNDRLALVIWGLGCGLSESRWFSKHNTHHQSPNHIGHDPDVGIPFVFSHDQARLRSNFQKRFLFPYQHYLFWVGIWFVYPYNLLHSMRHLFRDLTWRGMIELCFICTHFAVVLGFTFWFLPLSTALLFNVVVALFTGGYMAMIFAPNHKGEDMLTPEQQPNWVHQISLTRNIIPSPFISYLFGGLDRQIEHHLFPSMSRFQYHRAQPLVKEFCTEQDIPYKEVSWLESLREIHYSLKSEAKQWR